MNMFKYFPKISQTARQGGLLKIKIKKKYEAGVQSSGGVFAKHAQNLGSFPNTTGGNTIFF